MSDTVAEIGKVLKKLPRQKQEGFLVAIRLLKATEDRIGAEAAKAVPPERWQELLRLAGDGKIDAAQELADDIAAKALMRQTLGSDWALVAGWAVPQEGQDTLPFSAPTPRGVGSSGSRDGGGSASAEGKTTSSFEPFLTRGAHRGLGAGP